MPVRVLHIGDELQWRGGENQIALLVKGAKDFNVLSFVAYPERSEALPRFAELCEVCPLPSKKVHDPRSLWRLYKYCKVKNIQIVHTHSSKGMELGLALKTFLPQLKLVVHRRTAFPIKNNFFSRRKYLNEKVDLYICISDFIKKLLISQGVSVEKIRVAKSAVDINRYLDIDRHHVRGFWLNTLNLTEPVSLIVMASALTNEKGHSTALRALALIKGRGDFHLCIAGAGAENDKLMALSSSLGLNNRVSFLGKLNDVAELLKASDILLVPSRYEGLGTIALEGMAAGLVVIASRAGGLPEMVRHKETGLLITADDDLDLKNALELAMNDKNQVDNLSENARILLNQEFSLPAMVKGNVDAYQFVLST